MLLSGPERSRGHGCFEPETMRDHGSTPGEGPAGEGPAGRLPPVEETTNSKTHKNITEWQNAKNNIVFNYRVPLFLAWVLYT